MRKSIIFLAITLLLLCGSLTSSRAQGPTPTPNPDCKPADTIKALAALKSTGDKDKDIDALVKAKQSIDAMYSTCRGLSWKGTTVAKLIGPFDLPEGVYKATATTAGFLIIHIKVLSGDCEETSLFNLSDGEATTGSETTYESSGCKILLEPSNISAPWKLTIEPLQ